VPARGVISLATIVTVYGTLPLYLVGALAPKMAQDFTLSTTTLGLALSGYWVSASLGSLVSGPLSRRFDDRTLLVSSVAIIALGLVGIGLLATSQWWLVAMTVFVGIANGTAHPPANAVLQNRLPRNLQGFGFGLKQGAVPLASVVAGFSVPLVGAFLNWRLVFILAAVATLPLLVSLQKLREQTESVQLRVVTSRQGSLTALQRRRVRILAGVPLFGAGAMSASATLVTTAADGNDWSLPVVGSMLAVASIVAAAVRILLGVFIDRRGQIPRLGVIVMTASSVVGLALMTQSVLWLFIVGILISTGPGWGWPGILHQRAAEMTEPLVAQATGILQTAVGVSSAVAPVVAGVLLGSWGQGVTWLFLTVMAFGSFISAVVFEMHENRIARDSAPNGESPRN
jgi:MFS family permease